MYNIILGTIYIEYIVDSFFVCTPSSTYCLLYLRLFPT